jgi:hypothetical protein
MDCIIAYRVNGGPVEIVLGINNRGPAVFPNHDRAVAYADGNKLFQSGQANYQIITLDEL